MKLKSILVLLISLVVVIACTKDEPTLTGEEVSYAADIRPIIDAKCSNQACHGAGSTILELDTYEKVKLAAQKIRTKVWVEKSMPKNGSMSDADRELFKNWVDQGAKDN